jgi:hypothetical protein
MASNPVVVHVTPSGGEWHVKMGESPLLTLLSKETAVAEAHVQAVLSRPSRVVVHGLDGQVEDEATYPGDGPVDGTSSAPSATVRA